MNRKSTVKAAGKRSVPSRTGGARAVGAAAVGRLPLVAADVWQVGARRFDAYIDEGTSRYQPWVVLITGSVRGPAVAYAVSKVRPTAADLHRAITRAMAEPMGGDPGRPGGVAVEDQEQAGYLAPLLEEIGVACAVAKIDDVQRLFRAMSRDLLAVPAPTPAPAKTRTPAKSTSKAKASAKVKPAPVRKAATAKSARRRPAGR